MDESSSGKTIQDLIDEIGHYRAVLGPKLSPFHSYKWDRHFGPWIHHLAFAAHRCNIGTSIAKAVYCETTKLYRLIFTRSISSRRSFIASCSCLAVDMDVHPNSKWRSRLLQLLAQSRKSEYGQPWSDFSGLPVCLSRRPTDTGIVRVRHSSLMLCVWT
jgi:hypothetical protein